MTNKPYILKERIQDAKGNSFDLELYKRYNASSESTRYEYALKDHDSKDMVPDVIGTFEFLVNDGENYAIADDIYLDVNYRHHNLYRIILDHAKKFFKSIGLSGIMSKGRSRSDDATHSWEKIKTRQEESPENYNGKRYVDYYLESKSETRHIKMFEAFEVPQETRSQNINRIKGIATEEGLKIEGDFVFLYHGTSAANMKKIVSSGKLKMGTWLAKTPEESKRYAMTKVSDGKYARTDVFIVYMGSLTYNGYFCAQEDLFLYDGKYVPKGYKKT